MERHPDPRQIKGRGEEGEQRIDHDAHHRTPPPLRVQFERERGEGVLVLVRTRKVTRSEPQVDGPQSDDARHRPQTGQREVVDAVEAK